MKRTPSSILLAAALFWCNQQNVRSTTIDFEDASDSTSVGGLYSSLGVSFERALALTASVSLNEFDFPPHSGMVAITDDVVVDGQPLVATFAAPTSDISAYFSYASPLTIAVFDFQGNSLGTVNSASSSRLGASELIALPFSMVGRIEIAGATAGSLILDDLSFSSQPPVRTSDGQNTFPLLALGLFGVVATFRTEPPAVRALR